MITRPRLSQRFRFFSPNRIPVPTTTWRGSRPEPPLPAGEPLVSSASGESNGTVLFHHSFPPDTPVASTGGCPRGGLPRSFPRRSLKHKALTPKVRFKTNSKRIPPSIWHNSFKTQPLPRIICRPRPAGLSLSKTRFLPAFPAAWRVGLAHLPAPASCPALAPACGARAAESGIRRTAPAFHHRPGRRPQANAGLPDARRSGRNGTAAGGSGGNTHGPPAHPDFPNLPNTSVLPCLPETLTPRWRLVNLKAEGLL